MANNSYVIATPCKGVHVPLSHLAAEMEHVSDEAIGEACGEALVNAKSKGFDIHDPDFLIIVSFVQR
jgi:hypothetical protein